MTKSSGWLRYSCQGRNIRNKQAARHFVAVRAKTENRYQIVCSKDHSPCKRLA